jgi:hypothetical protein
MSSHNDRSAGRSLTPEPELVERVIHGQRVKVKVYPPTSDPRWTDWIRHTVRSPMDSFGIGDRILD